MQRLALYCLALTKSFTARVSKAFLSLPFSCDEKASVVTRLGLQFGEAQQARLFDATFYFLYVSRLSCCCSARFCNHLDTRESKCEARIGLNTPSSATRLSPNEESIRTIEGLLRTNLFHSSELDKLSIIRMWNYRVSERHWKSVE